MNNKLIEMEATDSNREQQNYTNLSVHEQDKEWVKGAFEKHLYDIHFKLERSLKIVKIALIVLAFILIVICATLLGLVLRQNGEIKALQTSLENAQRQKLQSPVKSVEAARSTVIADIDVDAKQTLQNITSSFKKFAETFGNFKQAVGGKLSRLVDTSGDLKQDIERALALPESCTNSSQTGYQILRNRTEAFCKDGWTVFQRRFDGSVDFNRTWQEYKIGFGNMTGEFWWGLENVHRIISNKICRLRIDLGGFDGSSAFAEYSSFLITGECDNYRLYLSGFSGDAGNSLTDPSHDHNGMQFTTKDRDNDKNDGNCAAWSSGKYGAWWFNSCHQSALNAPWGRSTGKYSKMIWKSWKGWSESVKESTMMFRCD